MEKTIITFLILIFSLNLSAQTHEFGLLEITNKDKLEVKAAMSKIQDLKIQYTLRNNRKVSQKVRFIDNSKLKFFPSIVSQKSNSCSCASLVHYIYSYEMNRLLDRDGKQAANVFSYIPVWNFLNKGVEMGAYVFQVLDILKEGVAIPSNKFNTESFTEWPSGLDIYKAGMSYRLKSIMKVMPEEVGSIEKMKQYLINHGDGSKYGGLIQFSAFADPLKATDYNIETYTGVKAIISKFGSSGMHSMVIVGFDDSVWCDYNEDKEKSSDEMGAFICVNSWGENWGDKGKFYAPYKTFTSLEEGKGGTGNGGKQCFTIDVETKKITAVIRLGLKHTSRDDIKLRIGGGTIDAKRAKKYRYYAPLNQQGGDHYLKGSFGSKNKFIEMGIDVSDLLIDKQSSSVFMNLVDSQCNEEGQGAVTYCTLIDYSVSPPREYVCEPSQNILNLGDYSKMKFSIKPTAFNDHSDTQFAGFDVSADCKSVSILLDVKKQSNVEIELLNELGVLVTSIYNGKLAAGTSIKTFDAEKNKIVAGSYFIRVITDNQVMCKTIEIK